MAALPLVTLLALLAFWHVRAHLAALAGLLVAAAIAIGVYGMPVTSSLSAADLVNRAEPDWWLTPRRMIQTNLREIDAGMDVEAYVASLKAAGANVVLFNVGGIVANYPTDLPYHYRNPFMQGDLAGEVVKRLHAEGIRMIARFDFSKVNERIAARPSRMAHPRCRRPFHSGLQRAGRDVFERLVSAGGNAENPRRGD